MRHDNLGRNREGANRQQASMSDRAQDVVYQVVWENPMHGSCIGNSYRRKAYLPGGGSRDPRVLKRSSTRQNSAQVAKWEKFRAAACVRPCPPPSPGLLPAPVACACRPSPGLLPVLAACVRCPRSRPRSRLSLASGTRAYARPRSMLAFCARVSGPPPALVSRPRHLRLKKKGERHGVGGVRPGDG